MGVTLNKKSTTTEPPPKNGHQPKPPGGLNAFYWFQIFTSTELFSDWSNYRFVNCTLSVSSQNVNVTRIWLLFQSTFHLWCEEEMKKKSIYLIITLTKKKKRNTARFNNPSLNRQLYGQTRRNEYTTSQIQD